MNTNKFYGFRYFSGYHTTTGDPHHLTGRLSIAGESVIFETERELETWLDAEKINIPTGHGGGRREQKTKKQLRELNLGSSEAEFNEMLEYAQND